MQKSWVVRALLSAKSRWQRGVEIPGDPPADDEPPRGESIEEGEVAMAFVETGFEYKITPLIMICPPGTTK